MILVKFGFFRKGITNLNISSKKKDRLIRTAVFY